MALEYYVKLKDVKALISLYAQRGVFEDDTEPYRAYSDRIQTDLQTMIDDAALFSDHDRKDV